VAGLVGIGVGMVLGSTGLVAGGTALTVGALGAAWAGGIMYDAHSRGRGESLDTIVEGEQHGGIAPGQGVGDPQARRHAAELTSQRHDALTRARQRGTWPVAGLGSYLILVLAVWLLVGQWILGYRYTELGQDAALRDQGFAIVVALCGLRLWVARRSPVASAFALVAGVLLVLAGALLPHSTNTAAFNEIATGVAVLLASGLTLAQGRASGPD